jgi:hypothetical protein
VIDVTYQPEGRTNERDEVVHDMPIKIQYGAGAEEFFLCAVPVAKRVRDDIEWAITQAEEAARKRAGF